MDEGMNSMTAEEKAKSYSKACMNCGQTFSFVPKQGRPPSKCENCRVPVKKKLSVAEIVAQEIEDKNEDRQDEKDL